MQMAWNEVPPPPPAFVDVLHANSTVSPRATPAQSHSTLVFMADSFPWRHGAARTESSGASSCRARREPTPRAPSTPPGSRSCHPKCPVRRLPTALSPVARPTLALRHDERAAQGGAPVPYHPRSRSRDTPDGSQPGDSTHASPWPARCTGPDHGACSGHAFVRRLSAGQRRGARSGRRPDPRPSRPGGRGRVPLQPALRPRDQAPLVRAARHPRVLAHRRRGAHARVPRPARGALGTEPQYRT